MTLKNSKEKIRAYALKNAIAHGGKAVAGSVLSSLFHEGLKKEDAKKHIKEINEAVLEANKLSLEQQNNEFKKFEKFVSERETREGLPELPDAKKGKVIMRFAPSASGPFHIGHALTSCISYLFVKKYGGKFYVRIEDTNPENIDPQSYKMIKEDSDWLFEKNYELIIQSDRIKIYYDYAKKLIKKNAAYICGCSSENFKSYVEKKENCPCRKFDGKKNLERWEKMLEKNGFKEGEAVLRFKSEKSMQDKNPAMRDFPLARINETKHARQGNKFRVWPLMNLAVAVDDIEFKMTHIIRAKDHRDNAERQKRIYSALGKKKFPWTSFLGRIKFKDIEISKTKMKHMILEGKYSGWDDPRLPTLISLRKRGYKPRAFWKFVERIGLSESDKVFDKKEFFTLLDYFNRDKSEKDF